MSDLKPAYRSPIRPVLKWNDNDEAFYRGYRIDRVHPIDRGIFGEDSCHIRKVDDEDQKLGYWIEQRSRHGAGAVVFPSVAMALDLIDYWKATDKEMDVALSAVDA